MNARPSLIYVLVEPASTPWALSHANVHQDKPETRRRTVVTTKTNAKMKISAKMGGASTRMVVISACVTQDLFKVKTKRIA